jgi:hypothetical protein
MLTARRRLVLGREKAMSARGARRRPGAVPAEDAVIALGDELSVKSLGALDLLDECGSAGEEYPPRARQPRQQEGRAFAEDAQEAEVQQDLDGSPCKCHVRGALARHQQIRHASMRVQHPVAADREWPIPAG